MFLVLLMGKCSPNVMGVIRKDKLNVRLGIVNGCIRVLTLCIVVGWWIIPSITSNGCWSVHIIFLSDFYVFLGFSLDEISRARTDVRDAKWRIFDKVFFNILIVVTILL